MTTPVMVSNEQVLLAADRMIQRHEQDLLELERLKKELEQKQAKRDILIPRIDLLENTRVFLQTLAEATRDEIMAGLQHVVTLCLQSTFGPHLHFEIEVETKRNNTGIEFYVVNTSGEEPVRLRPEGNMGGGVLDTISIGLRFGLLKVSQEYPLGPVFLDEPAKMVSADRIDSIANLLKELSNMFNKQIIMVTHHTSLIDIVDNSIYVKNENGVSICEQ